jgi:microcystin-dependent protein
MTITALPTPPSRGSSPSTFAADADRFLAALPTLATQINAAIPSIDAVPGYAASAAASAATAQAAANYKGPWSGLTGALAIPASASHNDAVWMLLTNTADVTLQQPGVHANWLLLGTPSVSGQAGKVLGTDGTSLSWIYGLPTGAELWWPSDTPPAGFLEEDGSSLLRAGTYAALFGVLGTRYGAADGTHFNLPDARGRFMRAWAHGSSNDPDRASRTIPVATGATMTSGDHVGTLQGDDFKAHTHSQYGTPTGGLTGNGTGGDGSSAQTGSTGGNETRPINTNRMLIIKY